MNWGIPGPGGSPGVCAVCGDSFLAECVLGRSVQTFTLEAFGTAKFYAHDKCLETLKDIATRDASDWKALPERSPIRRAFERALARDTGATARCDSVATGRRDRTDKRRLTMARERTKLLDEAVASGCFEEIRISDHMGGLLAPAHMVGAPVKVEPISTQDVRGFVEQGCEPCAYITKHRHCADCNEPCGVTRFCARCMAWRDHFAQELGGES